MSQKSVVSAIGSNTSLKLIKRLIQKGAPINQEGLCSTRPFIVNPIMLAMMHDNHPLFDMLLELGAKLEVVLSTGKTAFSCLMEGELRVGPEMRRKALQVMAMNTQRSRLCEVARRSDDVKDIETLLEAGCDVNEVDG